MRIGDDTYLIEYEQQIGAKLRSWFATYDFSNEQVDIEYNTKTSAVYSSNIEGNSLDVNSFLNILWSNRKPKQAKEVQEIEDLIAAYNYAQKHDLTEANFLHTHALLSDTILIQEHQGTYRSTRMGVFDDRGLVYVAIEPAYVAQKMSQFFEDITYLLNQPLNVAEGFYYAALLHLVFAHIHPFADGNGRSARLLEKWFLSKTINSRAWKLKSEKYYKEHLSDYYQNINLGVNYYELDYSRCSPFLKMLPTSLTIG